MLELTDQEHNLKNLNYFFLLILLNIFIANEGKIRFNNEFSVLYKLLSCMVLIFFSGLVMELYYLLNFFRICMIIDRMLKNKYFWPWSSLTPENGSHINYSLHVGLLVTFSIVSLLSTLTTAHVFLILSSSYVIKLFHIWGLIKKCW
jgi:hypothetical protein